MMMMMRKMLFLKTLKIFLTNPNLISIESQLCK